MIKFGQKSLDEILSDQSKAAIRDADRLPAEGIADIDAEAEAAKIAEQYAVDVAYLDEDSIFVEYDEIASQDGPTYRITFSVPYTRNRVGSEFLTYSRSGDLDLASMSIQNSAGYFFLFKYEVGSDFSPDEVRQKFQEDLQAVKVYLAQQSDTIAKASQALVRELVSHIEARRKIVASVPEKIAALGYPQEDPRNTGRRW